VSEQQRIVEGGCCQPDAKKLGIKPPDTPPPAHKPGWIYAILRWIGRKTAMSN